MAGRKPEPGIIYYRMNCGHTRNKKVRLLFNEFDANGYWIWQCIIEKAYESTGYFFDTNDKEELELFATDVCKKQVSLVDEVIQGCVRRGLFSQSVFDSFGICTSPMMQEVYLDATAERRRKGTSISFYKELLLIEMPTEDKNIVILPWNNSILPRNNGNLPRHNAQSKVEKSRGKKSKVEESIISAPTVAGEKLKVAKPEKEKIQHWKGVVDAWFAFYKSKFNGEEPSFKGSDPADLKKICIVLQKKVEARGNVWDETVSASAVNLFLKRAWDIDDNGWLQKNFLLSNLYKQIDKILNNPVNGNSTFKSKQAGVSQANTSQFNRIISGDC